MVNTFLQLIQDYTFQTVSLGSLLLGLISGVIGSFVVLRKQGLLGDGISHSTLPGIVLVFILMETKDSSMLLLGAGIFGLLAMFLILSISKYSRVKFDAALAIVFSVFFGLGMVGFSYIQGMPNASQAGLDSYIFGQAATMLRRDLDFMLLCGAVVLGLCLMFWKEFKLFIFDPEYAQSLGYSPQWLNLILSLMTVLGLILGLKTVGAILMCAMLIGPAVAARQWTNRFSGMVCLASLFACIAGVVGTTVSSLITKMPTGPTIVLVLSVLVFFSLLFAPQRGLITRLYHRHLLKKKGACHVFKS